MLFFWQLPLHSRQVLGTESVSRSLIRLRRPWLRARLPSFLQAPWAAASSSSDSASSVVAVLRSVRPASSIALAAWASFSLRVLASLRSNLGSAFSSCSAALSYLPCWSAWPAPSSAWVEAIASPRACIWASTRPTLNWACWAAMAACISESLARASLVSTPGSFISSIVSVSFCTSSLSLGSFSFLAASWRSSRLSSASSAAARTVSSGSAGLA